MNRAQRRSKVKNANKYSFKSLNNYSNAVHKREAEQMTERMCGVTLNIVALMMHETLGYTGAKLEPFIHKTIELLCQVDNFDDLIERTRRETDVWVSQPKDKDILYQVETREDVEKQYVLDPLPHWEREANQSKGYTRICSNCGEKSYQIGKNTLKFCSQCGAKMKEEVM